MNEVYAENEAVSANSWLKYLKALACNSDSNGWAREHANRRGSCEAPTRHAGIGRAWRTQTTDSEWTAICPWNEERRQSVN